MKNFLKFASILVLVALIFFVIWGKKWFFVDLSSKQGEDYSIASTAPVKTEPPSTSRPEPVPSQEISEASPPQDKLEGPGAVGAADNIVKQIDPQPTSTSNNVNQEANPDKPTYEILKAEADAKILGLRNKAQGELLDLVLQYQSTSDVKAKASLKAQGVSKVAGYDARFASTLSTFQSKLEAQGYDVTIIATYRQQYNQEKQLAQAFLGS